MVQQELINLAAYAQLGYGLVVVLVVVFAPTGLAGMPRRAAALVPATARGGRGWRRSEPFQPLPAAAAPAVDRRAAPARCRTWCKRFRGVTALDDVSLTVAYRGDPRHRRPQRLGQDHAVQRDQRALPAVQRPGIGWAAR